MTDAASHIILLGKIYRIHMPEYVRSAITAHCNTALHLHDVLHIAWLLELQCPNGINTFNIRGYITHTVDDEEFPFLKTCREMTKRSNADRTCHL